MIGVDNSLHEKSGRDIRYLPGKDKNRYKWRATIFSVETLDRVVLVAAAIATAMCLYLDWIVVYDDAALYKSFSLFQLSGSSSADLLRNEVEAVAVLLKVVIIATTVFWAFFVWRILLYSTEGLRLYANLAGVITVSLVVIISFSVTVLNSWNFESLNLPSSVSWLSLSQAPFVAAVCSITIMLLVSLRHRNKDRWQKKGVNARNYSQDEDMEVIINPEADYRLMYHGSHSVGFVADMGSVMAKNVLSDVTESVRKSISNEEQVCAFCGEFVRHKVSTCTNCGSRIPEELGG